MEKVVTVFGTRPEIIKMSLLIPLLDKGFDHSFLFTSQHYSKNMAQVFFDDLRLREPDDYLCVKSSDYRKLETAILKKLKMLKPSHVVVYGDTNSTLSGALAGRNVGAEIIHVEAGLRSFDTRMPEEYNRIKTDWLSSLLLAPTELNRNFIMREGIEGTVCVVGNTVVDACLHYLKRTNQRKCLQRFGIKKGEYILVTAHRQENVDDPRNVMKILKTLGNVGKTVLFPIHPRTKKRLSERKYTIPKNLRIVDAIGYLEFLGLLKNSALVLTDSGGVQEEAITLNVPCLTIRNSTERWETVIEGGNSLVGLEPSVVSYWVRMILESDLGSRMRDARNPYGDGNASRKAFSEIKEFVSV
ncbi:MAG: UDP-N-acetylglucosamine 2-epimerase (non-hydrolyzing) [Candidatus Micrarchaeota archaeon]